MIKKSVILFFTLVSFASISFAEDTSVFIPQNKKYEIKVDTTQIDVDPYSSKHGYTFDTHSKPAYYDPIYNGMYSPFGGINHMLYSPIIRP